MRAGTPFRGGQRKGTLTAKIQPQNSWRSHLIRNATSAQQASSALAEWELFVLLLRGGAL